ncbi:prepilin peptidase [Aestuariicoccus sp. MJ-SS9]|uniref:prepilin peptidase n=1 Tax=Aestuariicoccus sp. MJ-SS9 TaxID=3079855 RepID=UPI0029122829|nr:prepilin peptidase [Aestuariicoccus sp. MJ-SS9]MDU8912174.1 prepilin peptidase [Aestuariicoccus sp. MJ-SS9]
MSPQTAFDLFVLLAAPAVGSFLALLADRVPRGEPVGMARSACRGCGRALSPRDLVPVLSFAAARGRCRHCGAAIPPWLLYTEIAATWLAVLAVIAGTGLGQTGLIALILWTLLGLVATDLLWFRLPDVFTIALLALALVWAALWGHGAPLALVGAGLGAGAFCLIRLGYRALRGREGLGLGDVKLMAGLGALAGPWDLPLTVLLAASAALAVAALQRLGRADALDGARALPFGAALAGAGGALWLAAM